MDKLDLIYDITKEIKADVKAIRECHKQDLKELDKRIKKNTTFRLLITKGAAIITVVGGGIISFIKLFL